MNKRLKHAKKLLTIVLAGAMAFTPCMAVYADDADRQVIDTLDLQELIETLRKLEYMETPSLPEILDMLHSQEDIDALHQKENADTLHIPGVTFHLPESIEALHLPDFSAILDAAGGKVKDAFDTYKEKLKDVVDVIADSYADALDPQKLHEIADNAKAAIDVLKYVAADTLEKNKGRADIVISNLKDNLSALHEADVLHNAQDLFDEYKEKALEVIDELAEKYADFKDAISLHTLVENAKDAINSLSLHATDTLEEATKRVDSIVRNLTRTVTEAVTSEAEKALSAKFNEYKKSVLASVSELEKKYAAFTDRLSVKNLIAKAKEAINEIKYDITKTYEQNVEKIKKAFSNLKSELEKRKSGDSGKKEGFSSEWIKGKWYNKDGSQTYKPAGAWVKDEIGWMYKDTAGWFPRNCWQRIDGKWYYFHDDGHAASGEFVQGWWVEKNTCQCTDPYKSDWHKTQKGWWYGDKTGWYAKNNTYIINGTAYTFDKEGYLQ